MIHAKAASIGRNDALRLLVEAGGDLNSYSLHDNEDRMTCLHFAVWCNHVDTVKLCLSLGADLGLEGTWLDYTGTPLDFAQQFRHKVGGSVWKEGEARFTKMICLRKCWTSSVTSWAARSKGSEGVRQFYLTSSE